MSAIVLSSLINIFGQGKRRSSQGPYEVILNFHNINLSIVVLHNLYTGGILICFKNFKYLFAIFCNNNQVYMSVKMRNSNGEWVPLLFPFLFWPFTKLSGKLKN